MLHHSTCTCTCTWYMINKLIINMYSICWSLYKCATLMYMYMYMYMYVHAFPMYLHVHVHVHVHLWIILSLDFVLPLPTPQCHILSLSFDVSDIACNMLVSVLLISAGCFNPLICPSFNLSLL